MNLLSEVITKVAQSSLKGIGKKQMRLTNKLVEHINTLTEAINEVQNTVEADTYGVDPSDTLVTPLQLSSVKIKVQSQAMETGT